MNWLKSNEIASIIWFFHRHNLLSPHPPEIIRINFSLIRSDPPVIHWLVSRRLLCDRAVMTPYKPVYTPMNVGRPSPLSICHIHTKGNITPRTNIYNVGWPTTFSIYTPPQVPGLHQWYRSAPRRFMSIPCDDIGPHTATWSSLPSYLSVFAFVPSPPQMSWYREFSSLSSAPPDPQGLFERGQPVGIAPTVKLSICVTPQFKIRHSSRVVIFYLDLPQ